LCSYRAHAETKYRRSNHVEQHQDIEDDFAATRDQTMWLSEHASEAQRATLNASHEIGVSDTCICLGNTILEHLRERVPRRWIVFVLHTVLSA